MADTYEQLTRDLLRALDEAHLHNIQAVTRIADQINALRLSQADITAQTLKRGEANIQEQISQNVARMEHITKLARRARDLAPPNADELADYAPVATIDDRTCSICGRSFRYPRSLREHQTRKTSCAPIIYPQDYPPETLNDPDLKTRTCKHCGRVFSNRTSALRHIRQNCKIASTSSVAGRHQ